MKETSESTQEASESADAVNTQSLTDGSKDFHLELRSYVTVETIQWMGSDEKIAAAARVSTKAEESMEFHEKNEGLINYLMKNRHGTPFEHNAITFFIQAPIFVFREFHRHRIGWSYNEESARYRQLRPIFYVPDDERPLIQEGKPGHYIFKQGTHEQSTAVRQLLAQEYKMAYEAYTTLIDSGVAREVARACLPVSIYSSMYATCNARSLMNFLSLRTKRLGSTFPSFPQREIEMVAEEMEKIFGRWLPITYKAFNAHGRVAP